MRPVWTVGLLAIALLAGCIDGDETEELTETEEPQATAEAPQPPEGVDFETAIPDLHPHENPALHNGGAYLELLAHNDLTEGAAQSGAMQGAYNEVSTCGDLAAVASFAGSRGFTLVDISDPADPTVLSQFPTSSTNWDVRIGDNCTTVFVAMELGVFGEETSALPNLMGAEDAGRRGIIVVDVSDPTDPVVESKNIGASAHNVYSFDHNNETYVFNEETDVMRLVGDRGSRTLEVLGRIPGTHDVSVATHPGTGEPYIFTGASDLSIFHLEDTIAALEAGEEASVVGSMDDPEHTAWHEQTAAPALLDGRWILVGAGESGNGLALPYSIVDITDPEQPTPLAHWTLPGAPFETRGFYTFSPHNIDIREDGRVATANYHAGTWVFDVSTQERQSAPVTLGYYFPDEVAPTVAKTIPYSPYVWGGEFTDSGELVVADLNSGLYVFGVE